MLYRNVSKNKPLTIFKLHTLIKHMVRVEQLTFCKNKRIVLKNKNIVLKPFTRCI